MLPAFCFAPVSGAACAIDRSGSRAHRTLARLHSRSCRLSMRLLRCVADLPATNCVASALVGACCCSGLIHPSLKHHANTSHFARRPGPCAYEDAALRGSVNAPVRYTCSIWNRGAHIRGFHVSRDKGLRIAWQTRRCTLNGNGRTV